ncbi:MAG: DUF2795 domain-containing protein [Acidimicrobiia bacterium]|nr:DUF2795 domain-containing protein [Acidimicrobiia bacterium]
MGERSRLAACLATATFPASALDLAEVAEAHDAPASMVEALRSLPAERSYETFAEVWVDLGGEMEHRS